MWVVSFTPQEESPWYPSDRRLGEPQSRSVQSGEEKYSQPLLELEPAIIHPVVWVSKSEANLT